LIHKAVLPKLPVNGCKFSLIRTNHRHMFSKRHKTDGTARGANAENILES